MHYYEEDSDTEFQDSPRSTLSRIDSEDDFWKNNKYARAIPRDTPPPVRQVQQHEDSIFASVPEIENEIELPTLPQKRKLNLPLKLSLLYLGGSTNNLWNLHSRL
eukprot:CAMPEP_0168578760 /NCGR_PEP_ID=MMETSP0413-20121227/21505_1 /TAXON_ID=136452 /ORGANISM="Filamoeba nolandi, Strain NC-AS-23-1" /LENGTH=104 /DNA_ID=CAMNT_0008612629 /DNA_START=38 /DNA_END=352 /DNA_ORIENTATION=+